VLPHRTQILYWPDISFISSWLDLTPGKVVVESGTGSGSFSHSIARAIAPTGRLYSYEYHKDRFEKAQLEFKQHKLEDVVVSKHRDVIADGFDVQDTADAVFLDLPAPWDVIAAAKKAMRRDSIGRICCFSPCIEQVQRTALALDRHGFTRICMYECLSRDYSVQRIPLPDISAVFDGGKVKFKQLESLQKNANKRRRLEGADGEAATGNGNGLVDVEASADEDAHYVLTSKCNAAESRGHTSYLTFAVLVPSQQDGAPEGTTAEAAVESASSEQSLKQA
ncbi:tRNA (adenine-N(1)-)-methyltransferase catalytic subunit trm61, partial [Spiromyces aspiralis]